VQVVKKKNVNKIKNLLKTSINSENIKLKNEEKKRGILIVIIIMAVLDMCAITCLFLTYGPISYFRDLLITTAMTTMNHKYLAYTFYTEEIIDNVLSKNYVKEVNENTNVNDIQIENFSEKIEYNSVYEKELLTRDENDLYKVIPLEGSNYKGYLVAIYDPSRISLVKSKYYGNWGELLEGIANDNEARVAVNASGFDDLTGRGIGAVATGIFINNGILVSGNQNTKGKIIGFNKNHILVLMEATAKEAIEADIVDAVDFGPFLIVNGKPSEIKGNGGWGISARTAIAQRKDGIVLFLVIDGRQPGYSMGVDMRELVKILVRYGAYNAANLDGGASSSLNIEGKLISKPCAVDPKGERPIPNAWIVK